MPGLHTGLNTRPALCILHLRRINANYNLIAHLRSLRAQGLTKLRINEKSVAVCAIIVCWPCGLSKFAYGTAIAHTKRSTP